MARCQILLGLWAFVLTPSMEAAILRGTQGTNMQPELVAKTLKKVEDDWKDEAATFIRCNATQGIEDCNDMSNAFDKSCATVVGAVVQGSSGDERIASEYMADICGQSLLDGWHKMHCLGLKSALDVAMTADSYENRNSFTAQKLCKKFWSKFIEEEKQRFVKEEADRKEAEKKAAEESARKEKEAAEKAQKAKEEQAKLEKQAKEIAEKRAAAEAARKKIEDATRVKEEAKAKAAKAAEELAKKKAEAEEFAKKAQQKIEEAAEAEREHKKAVAHLSAHENATAEVVTNTTAAEKHEKTELKPAPVAKKETPVPPAAAKPAAAAKPSETAQKK